MSEGSKAVWLILGMVAIVLFVVAILLIGWFAPMDMKP